MALSLRYDMNLKITDPYALGLDNVEDANLIHTLGTIGGTLSSNSSVPITKPWSDNVAMTAGAVTLDFTALDQVNLPVVNATGLKLQLFIFRNLSANSNTITIKDGATNGYDIFGDSSGQITLNPGEVEMRFCNESLEDVSATVKTIDITGTGTETLEVVMAFG